MMNSFGFYDQMVVFTSSILDDARSMLPSRHSGIEAVAAQVVEAGSMSSCPLHQLVEETLGVFILEYLDGKCQFARSFLC